MVAVEIELREAERREVGHPDRVVVDDDVERQREAREFGDVLQRLRVSRLKDGTRLKGTVLSAQTETFTLKPRTRIPVAGRDIRYDAIDSLERTTVGMSPAKKVLIGVAAGVGAAVVLVAILVASAWD
jgi:hypothetical protein